MAEKTPPKKVGVSDALRRAGYVRIPSWWVRPDELEAIHRIAHNHEEDVKRIRKSVWRKAEDDHE